MVQDYEVGPPSPHEWALIRRGPVPRNSFVALLVLGLIGLLFTWWVAGEFPHEPEPVFMCLILSGIPLALAGAGMGFELGRARRWIAQPGRVALVGAPLRPELEIDRARVSGELVERIEFHVIDVPAQAIHARRFVVGIVSGPRVAELVFDDFDRARSAVLELATRLGIEEVVLFTRPSRRFYVLPLAIMVVIGIMAPLAAAMWMTTFEWPLLPTMAGLLVTELAVFGLTWAFTGPASADYLAREYGPDRVVVRSRVAELHDHIPQP